MTRLLTFFVNPRLLTVLDQVFPVNLPQLNMRLQLRLLPDDSLSVVDVFCPVEQVYYRVMKGLHLIGDQLLAELLILPGVFGAILLLLPDSANVAIHLVEHAAHLLAEQLLRHCLRFELQCVRL